MEVKELIRNLTSGALVSSLSFSQFISCSNTGEIGNFINKEIPNNEYSGLVAPENSQRILEYVEKYYASSTPSMTADFFAAIENIASKQIAIDSDLQQIMDDIMLKQIGKGPTKQRFA